MTKEKWFGTCQVCGAKEQPLGTTKTNTGQSVNYTIIKACDHCSMILHVEIERVIRLLRIDQKQKDKEKENKK